jgi:hypothetical protein
MCGKEPLPRIDEGRLLNETATSRILAIQDERMRGMMFPSCQNRVSWWKYQSLETAGVGLVPLSNAEKWFAGFYEHQLK